MSTRDIHDAIYWEALIERWAEEASHVRGTQEWCEAQCAREHRRRGLSEAEIREKVKTYRNRSTA